MRLYLLLLLLPFVLIVSFSLNGQIPCENGMINGIYPCNQISLLSHITPEELNAVELDGFYLNDIWGWTDSESGKEYAIIGLVDGVVFVDVSDPINPVVLGRLDESNPSGGRKSANRVLHGKSQWRDMKTFKDHVFIVSDLNIEHSGMQVFDLTRLRDNDGSSVVAYTEDAYYANFERAHNIAINEETGFAYTVGSRFGDEPCSGGLHSIDINDAKNPVFVGCFSDDGYTHDTQCVSYSGSDVDHANKEICFSSNENSLTITNVSDKEAMSLISRTSYENFEYSHQGWLTEDQKYFLMNDELDERAFGHNARTLIWDVQDLDNPVLIGDYYNNIPSIDHNLYIRDNLVYASNYESGLRILDLSEVANGKLKEVAHFDSYPEGNNIDFSGNWSNYPYFESGTIIMSDINNGLFILKLDLEDDIITAHPEDQITCEVGSEISFSLETSLSNLNLQWQYFDKQYFDLIEDENTSGVNDNQLNITATTDNASTRYRCKITDELGNVYYTFEASYQFHETLTGSALFEYEVSNSGLITLTNLSTNADSYFWTFGDGSTSTEQNPTHQFENGAYDIRLDAINECDTFTYSASINVIILSTSGEINSYQLYPNPVRNELNLKGENGDYIEVIDLSGKLILSKTLDKIETTINFENLKKGIYFLSIHGSDLGHSEVHRLIKD